MRATPFLVSTLAFVTLTLFIWNRALASEPAILESKKSERCRVVEYTARRISGLSAALGFSKQSQREPMVVGYYQHDSGYPTGRLALLGGHLDFAESRVLEVNAIAKNGLMAGTDGYQGVLIEPSGQISAIPALEDLPFQEPVALNSDGKLVGNSYGLNGPRAFFSHRGASSYLSDLLFQSPGWEVSYSQGINEAGDIIAYGSFEGGFDQGLLLTRINNERYELVPLPFPPNAINRRGEIVGFKYKRSKEGALRQIPAPTGTYSVQLYDINDQGEILGTYVHENRQSVFRNTALSGSEDLNLLVQDDSVPFLNWVIGIRNDGVILAESFEDERCWGAGACLYVLTPRKKCGSERSDDKLVR